VFFINFISRLNSDHTETLFIHFHCKNKSNLQLQTTEASDPLGTIHHDGPGFELDGPSRTCTSALAAVVRPAWASFPIHGRNARPRRATAAILASVLWPPWRAAPLHIRRRCLRRGLSPAHPFPRRSASAVPAPILSRAPPLAPPRRAVVPLAGRPAPPLCPPRWAQAPRRLLHSARRQSLVLEFPPRPPGRCSPVVRQNAPPKLALL
jgi:hypothetical protein